MSAGIIQDNDSTHANSSRYDGVIVVLYCTAPQAVLTQTIPPKKRRYDGIRTDKRLQIHFPVESPARLRIIMKSIGIDHYINKQFVNLQII